MYLASGAPASCLITEKEVEETLYECVDRAGKGEHPTQSHGVAECRAQIPLCLLLLRDPSLLQTLSSRTDWPPASPKAPDPSGLLTSYCHHSPGRAFGEIRIFISRNTVTVLTLLGFRAGQTAGCSGMLNFKEHRASSSAC